MPLSPENEAFIHYIAGAAPASAEATGSVDTPHGVLVYRKAVEAEILPIIQLALKTNAEAGSLQDRMDAADDSLQSWEQVFNSIDKLVHEIRTNTSPATNAQARAARESSHVAKKEKTDVAHLRSQLELVRAKAELAHEQAKQQFLEAAAKDLREQAESIEKGYASLFGALSKAIDVATAKPDDRVTELGKAVFEAVGDLISGYLASDLKKKAADYAAQAEKLGADNVAENVRIADAELQEMGSYCADAVASMQEAATDQSDDWTAVQESYDKNTKGKLRFADMLIAIGTAIEAIKIARQCKHAAEIANVRAEDLFRRKIPWRVDENAADEVIRKLGVDGNDTRLAAQDLAERVFPARLERFRQVFLSARKAIASAHPDAPGK